MILIADCGGKVCYNGGTLNLNTCQCECKNLYKGEMCEQRKWKKLYFLLRLFLLGYYRIFLACLSVYISCILLLLQLTVRQKINGCVVGIGPPATVNDSPTSPLTVPTCAANAEAAAEPEVSKIKLYIVYTAYKNRLYINVFFFIYEYILDI